MKKIIILITLTLSLASAAYASPPPPIELPNLIFAGVSTDGMQIGVTINKQGVVKSTRSRIAELNKGRINLFSKETNSLEVDQKLVFKGKVSDCCPVSHEGEPTRYEYYAYNKNDEMVVFAKLNKCKLYTIENMPNNILRLKDTLDGLIALGQLD